MFDSCRDMETSSHFLWVSTETRIPTSSTIDAGSSSKRVKSKIVSCQLGFEVPASIFDTNVWNDEENPQPVAASFPVHFEQHKGERQKCELAFSFYRP